MGRRLLLPHDLSWVARLPLSFTTRRLRPSPDPSPDALAAAAHGAGVPVTTVPAHAPDAEPTREESVAEDERAGRSRGRP
jgi:hypothetical protein